MSSSEAKKSNRINFSTTTKLELAKRVGFRCSYERCLKITTGPTQNEKGEDSAATIGVAAHIYPASPNGPRGQEGLAPEDIKNISNGIWLCHTHGTLIDNFVGEYPSEKLRVMKEVREYAQGLIIRNAIIHDLESRVGVHDLDDIVWRHWPNPDEQQIMLEYVIKGAQRLLEFGESLSTKMPVPPWEFHRNPISMASSVALSNAVHVHPVRQDSFPAERTRAVQIVSAWTRSIRSWGWEGEGLHIIDGYVKIAARNPETGEIAEPYVWSHGMAAGAHSFNVVDGESIVLEINHTAHQTSNLNWQLKVHIKDGVCRTNSTMSMWKHITPGRSYESHKREEVEAYFQVLEKLAAGWEPIGFVGLEPGKWSEPDTVHPEAFSIQSEITPEQFANALHRCAKVKLGYELADTWELEFRFNDAFFLEVLDETSIRSASKALRAKLGSGPYPLYACGENVVAVNERYSLRLCVNHGSLYFEGAQTAPLNQRVNV
ncbi:TPA: HNH endonuclease [Pseudomonas aeruginosa]